MFFWSFLFLAVAFFEGARETSGAAVENSYFERCSLGSKNLEECIQNSIMEAKPSFIKGIPEIGLPNLEPMVFRPFNFKESNKLVKVAVSLSDLYLEGLSNMTVEDVAVFGDFDSRTRIEITVTTPLFRGFASWAGKGRFFQFGVNGSGKIAATSSGTTLKVYLTGRTVTNENDGKKYFALDSVKWDDILGKTNVEVTGLFPKDRILDKMLNDFLNENMMFAWSVVKPILEKNTRKEFEKLARAVFDTWSIDELLQQ